MTYRISRGNDIRVYGIRHLLAQRQLALLICCAALFLKLLIPTGYMIVNNHGSMGLVACSGFAPAPSAMTMDEIADGGAMVSRAMSKHGDEKDHGKTEMPCAFAGLSAQIIGAVDVVLLTISLAVVAAKALHSIPQRTPTVTPYLRPPLRGPPRLD